MKLDSVTVVPFPDSAAWASMYAKFFDALVKSLNHAYCSADREDAVAEAFHKLEFKKARESYETLPETEADWFHTLRWQAKSYLSHLRERYERHARYVESMAKALARYFACGHQGEAIDAEIMQRALTRTLETIKEEQDISRRDLEIFVAVKMFRTSARELSKRFSGVTAGNVSVIAHRVGNIIRKYGPRHFERALRREGYGPEAA